MNVFYLDKQAGRCATLHCDKHVVKMIIEYAQLLSTAHRVLDGEQYEGRTANNRRIKRWRMEDELMENTLYKASHINHPSAIWTRSSIGNYQYLLDLWRQLSFEYTYRYGKVHMTDEKLRDLLNQLPKNIKLGEWSQPPQCMPDDVKVENDSLSAYHKYYAVYKKDFAKWTNRPVPNFMSA